MNGLEIIGSRFGHPKDANRLECLAETELGLGTVPAECLETWGC